MVTQHSTAHINFGDDTNNVPTSTTSNSRRRKSERGGAPGRGEACRGGRYAKSGLGKAGPQAGQGHQGRLPGGHAPP